MTAADDQFLTELQDDFFAESDDHIQGIERGLLALEALVNQPSLSPSLLDDLFRHFHSLKGLTGMVGLREAEQLAHLMESYLRALRQDRVVLSPQGLEALIAGTRSLVQVLGAHRSHGTIPDVTGVLTQITQVTPSAAAPPPDSGSVTRSPAQDPVHASQESATLSAEERARLEAALQKGARAWHFQFAPAPDLAERGINVAEIRARLQASGELIHAAPRIMEGGGIAFEFIVASDAAEELFTSWAEDGVRYTPWPVQASGAAPLAREPAPAATTTFSVAPSNVVRVDLTRLDDLMRMLGNLMITRARLQDAVSSLDESVRAPQVRLLEDITEAFGRQLRDLREGVMRVRLVPIGEILERMHFVVRDLAAEAQKQVRLETIGKETEIDKLIVERMMEPLLHLVRNAVSHGIETPAERITAGKPPEGTIALRATTAGDSIVIEVEDDGRGIATEQVTAKARALGWIGRTEALDTLSLVDLICLPGFSTRDQADRASGRGVGMSVVKNTVEELGGTLAVDSQVGRGTRFTIQVPLTLAIVDALIVGVGEQVYAVPLSTVREVVEVSPAAVTRLEKNELLPYQAGVLPLLHLARQFGVNEKFTRASYALVVGSGLNLTGIVVDRILGQREIVVQALTDPLVQTRGISGATELGDGRVVLIVDTGALARSKKQVTQGQA